MSERREAAAPDSAITITFTFTYQITENLPNGEPWPPDGNDYWGQAPGAPHGFTRWRRVELVT